MLVCMICTCNNSESLLRSALKKYGYPEFLSIPVHKGKDKSLTALASVPPFPEVQEVEQYIKTHSKFAIILGYMGDMCRWADVASSKPTATLDAELIVKNLS